MAQGKDFGKQGGHAAPRTASPKTAGHGNRPAPASDVKFSGVPSKNSPNPRKAK